MDFLDYENIERSTPEVERHPLSPFLPEGCKVLFLGSFPPQRKRWAKGFNFFYPNYINDHWRIEGVVFYSDKNHFVDEANKTFRLPEIVSFLKEKGIGFYDTATAVHRAQDNASDKFLEVIEQTDINHLLMQIPQCQIIAVTGEKAASTICEYFCVGEIPKVNNYITIKSETLGRQLYLYRLPSSSRAYPLSLDKKAQAYREMFRFCGMV